MGQPAARLTDMHVCPMVTPGVPPIPHVGGPIVSPGAPTVITGGLPQSKLGDMCTCVGPPDTIVKGSAGVMAGKAPAVRIGDLTAHGGSIVMGCFTVLIGEVGSTSISPPTPSMVDALSGGSGMSQPSQQAATLIAAYKEGAYFCRRCLEAQIAIAQAQQAAWLASP